MHDVPNDQLRQFKESLTAEIFTAYREAATLYRKTDSADVRDMLLAMQHGFEMMLKHLFPLDEQANKMWDELRKTFAD